MLIKLKKLFSSKTTVLLLLTISSSCMLRTNENQSFNALILSLTNTISVLNSSSTASQPSDVLKEQVLNKGGNFDEYYGALDSSIDIEQGMPVNSPVHFVLEVSGAAEDAVSFEFRFL